MGQLYAESRLLGWRKVAFYLLLLCFCIGILGCAPPIRNQFYQPGQTDMLVHDITIRGNKVFSSSTIKSKIVTYVNPGWRADVENVPIFGARHSYYNPLTWEKDKLRIITMYHAYGYFNATIAVDKVTQVDDGKAVDLYLKIDENKPTKIRNISYIGLSTLDPTLSDADLNEALNLEKETVFNQSTYLKAKDKLSIMLRNRSYAYSTVRGKVYVFPSENIADIYFYVDLGPKCTFGDITIEGLGNIGKEYVEEAITIKPGDPYSPLAMQETQASIYDLGVFSVVKVALASELVSESQFMAKELKKVEDEKDIVMSDVSSHNKELIKPEPIEKQEDVYLTDAEKVSAVLDAAQASASERTALSSVVPIVIRLREAKELNIRMGVGFSVEPQNAAVKLRFDWIDRNFLGGLRKIEHFNEIGYAWADNRSSILPNFTNPSNQGWVARSELRFTQPQFIEPLTSLNVNLMFKREIHPNWTLMAPSFQIGLSRTWFKHLRTDISYNASLNYLSHLNILSSNARPPREYILEYFEQRIILNYLNNLINPTSGGLLDLTVQEATSYIGRIPKIPGGDFDYILAQIELQGYIPYHFGIDQVLALRLKLGSIYTFGRAKLAPLPQRLHGGGVNSIRSFGNRQFSIYTADNFGAYALGGFTQAEAAIEPRFLIVKDLLGVGDFWGAIYADAATILPGQFLFQTEANKLACSSPDGCVESFRSLFSSLIYGVGAALWWITPVGPIRVDFAYTISDFRKDKRFKECLSATDSRGFCLSGNYYPPEDDLINLSLRSWNIYFGIGHTF